MRFLVDRCAGSRLSAWLSAKGHDVVDASQWEQDPGDAAILHQAVAEDRILITMDTDFGLLVFAEGRLHRGIIRLPDCPAGERIAIVQDLLTRHADDVAGRAIITVRGGRIRISRRPEA